MADEDRSLLNGIIRQEHEKSYPTLKLDTYFELFSAEQILKSRSYDLDQEQIRSGNMGGGRDGGVDSFYVFANRRLVRDDTDLAQLKGQRVDIEVLIVQSKNSAGFSEDAFDKFTNFLDHVLRLSASPAPESATLYSQTLRDAVSRFHTLFRNSLTQRPHVRILFFYATVGEQVHAAIQARQALLQRRVQDAFSTAEVPACTLLGAKQLLQLFYARASKTFSMDCKLFIPQGQNA